MSKNFKQSLCVVVELQNTDKAIRILRNHKIINFKLKIQRDTRFSYIPLTHEISNELEKLNGKYHFETINFEEKNIKLRSLKAYLEEYIPSVNQEKLPVAYDQIGEIGVIDLKPEFLQFQSIVGNGILEINPSIKSVYRKLSKVDGMYRIRPLQLIAGEDNPRTIYKEYGILFDVDISKIYFSPRLSSEHNRIANLTSDQEVVLDMFTGIGAFAFHIINKLTCEVYVIDINPETEITIKRSLKMNKQFKGRLHSLIGDAREICLKFIEDKIYFDRIIMNHPSGAIEFLDIAEKLIKTIGMIHLYIFIEPDEVSALIDKLHLDYPQLKVVETRYVRQSSPTEFHTCFTLQKL